LRTPKQFSEDALAKKKKKRRVKEIIMNYITKGSLFPNNEDPSPVSTAKI